MEHAFIDIKATQSVFQAVSARFEAYLQAPIPQQISEHDQMFARGVPGANDHYMSVGHSAIEVIIRAMICSRKTTIGSVLDLPSGAGRVTRHLRAFFPACQLFVGELNTPARQFAVENFSATALDVAQDFSGKPPRTFDLIFVGSLLTHFNAGPFSRALNWFVRSLAPGGLLVVTTHGRRHDQFEREGRHLVDPAKWIEVSRSFRATGFGYIETDRLNDASYGFSLSAPSWVLSLVEHEPMVTIISFQEAAWDSHQDVLVVQRKY
jgi:SAM-dependent methyltransferase